MRQVVGLLLNYNIPFKKKNTQNLDITLKNLEKNFLALLHFKK